MQYNVKIIDYLDSTQVRIYGRPVKLEDKIKNTESLQKTNEKQTKQEKSQRTYEQVQHSIRTSVNRTVNQIYALSRSNRWDYFITLTIDPKKLDSTDFNLISEKLNIWTNNLKRRYCPDLKYIIVPELHKDKTKWHFHGLFANVGNLPLVFSGKVCVGKYIYDYAKKPYATKIFNLPLWKYGYSTATKVCDTSRASSYITKYITKDLSRILQNQRRFLASQNVNRPVERVYNIDYSQLQEIMLKHFEYLDYMTNVQVPCASQEITYMEFNKDETRSLY